MEALLITAPAGWTDWEFSTSCSVTCGEGTQEVSRVCQYGEGCQLGQIESRTVTCQREACDCEFMYCTSLYTCPTCLNKLSALVFSAAFVIPRSSENNV